MTIKELINRLQQVSNKEMKVIVNGYKNGFEDIKDIKSIIAHQKINFKESGEKYEQSSSGQGGTVMLLLSR